MMNVEQVATHFSVSTKTVRRWISTGQLKCFQLGGVYRVSEQQVEAFVAQNEMQHDTRANA